MRYLGGKTKMIFVEIFPPRMSKNAHPWWGKTVNSKCSTLVGKMLQKMSSPPPSLDGENVGFFNSQRPRI